MEIQFWASTKLDAKVKKYNDILEEFFQYRYEAAGTTTMVVPLTSDLLDCLHGLDNAIRRTVSPLTRFDHIWWSPEMREAAIKEMEVLAETEVILPRVRRLLDQLEAEMAKGPSLTPMGMKTVDMVLTCGQATLQSLGNSLVTPWPGPNELSMF